MMIVEKGKRYRFSRINGMTDAYGYIIEEDQDFFRIMEDGQVPICINKRFIAGYKVIEVEQ